MNKSITETPRRSITEMILTDEIDKAINSFHVVYTLEHKWKFFKHGLKHSYITNKDKSLVMQKAIDHINWNGGKLVVHKEDASVDFIYDI